MEPLKSSFSKIEIVGVFLLYIKSSSYTLIMSSCKDRIGARTLKLHSHSDYELLKPLQV